MVVTACTKSMESNVHNQIASPNIINCLFFDAFNLKKYTLLKKQTSYAYFYSWCQLYCHFFSLPECHFRCQPQMVLESLQVLHFILCLNPYPSPSHILFLNRSLSFTFTYTNFKDNPYP